MYTTSAISDLLRCQYFVIHIIQRGAVSHVEGPEESVPLFLYLLCLRKQMNKHVSVCFTRLRSGLLNEAAKVSLN